MHNKNYAYFCIEFSCEFNGPGRFPVKNEAMKNFELPDAEILAIFNKALNEKSAEEKAAARRAKVRAAKADFFNLNATDYCKFVPAK